MFKNISESVRFRALQPDIINKDLLIAGGKIYATKTGFFVSWIRAQKPSIARMNRFLRIAAAFFLVSVFHHSAKACSPINVPTLVSWNVTGCNLNLNWSSNTTYNCQYFIQVELICNSATFLGNGN